MAPSTRQSRRANMLAQEQTQNPNPSAVCQSETNTQDTDVANPGLEGTAVSIQGEGDGVSQCPALMGNDGCNSVRGTVGVFAQPNRYSQTQAEILAHARALEQARALHQGAQGPAQTQEHGDTQDQGETYHNGFGGRQPFHSPAVTRASGSGLVGDQTAQIPPGASAWDIAIQRYGNNLNFATGHGNINADVQAKREPLQRRESRQLNLNRASNLKALIVQISGDEVARECGHCSRGLGPWKTCVIREGMLYGSCSNCWYNASGNRCAYHKDNVRQREMENRPPLVQDPSQAVAAAHILQVLQPTLNAQQPTLNAQQPALTSQQPAPNNYSYYLPPPTALDIAMGAASNTLNQLGEPLRTTVSEAITAGSNYSMHSRYIARIEAATQELEAAAEKLRTTAQELGFRIAEYEEWRHTPEGRAEEFRAEAEMRRHQQRQAAEQAETNGAANGTTADTEEEVDLYTDA